MKILIVSATRENNYRLAKKIGGLLHADYKMITLDTTYGKGTTEFFDGGQMDELYEAKAFK